MPAREEACLAHQGWSAAWDAMPLWRRGLLPLIPAAVAPVVVAQTDVGAASVVVFSLVMAPWVLLCLWLRYRMRRRFWTALSPRQRREPRFLPGHSSIAQRACVAIAVGTMFSGLGASAALTEAIAGGFRWWHPWVFFGCVDVALLLVVMPEMRNWWGRRYASPSPRGRRARAWHRRSRRT